MLRFADPGGAIYGTAGTGGANILAYWTSSQGIASWSVSAGNGRAAGTPSLRMATAAAAASLTKTISSSVQTLGMAAGFRCNTALPAATAHLMTFYDGGTAQVDVRLTPAGTLQVTKAGTVLGTSSAALSANVYYHIEFKVKIDPSAGTVEVRLNGVAVVGPLTAQNTRNTANSTANGAGVGTTATIGAVNADFCDLVVWDTAATDANGFSDINDFIGDCGVYWLPASGAGTTTQFTPNPVVANYLNVDDATPDGDTTYVESSTVANVDTYALTDLPTGIVTVKTLASILYARKSDVGTRAMKAAFRSAGGNAFLLPEFFLSNSYLYYLAGSGQDPHGGSAANWTPAAVNALEAGQQIST